MTMAAEVEAVLRQELTPQEEQVLQLRYGTARMKREIDAVAPWLSLTPRTLHRIERCALRKLLLAAVMEARNESAKAG